MKIFVAGLWHLGSVTAACIAEHHATIGFDPNPETILRLSHGTPPVAEPGLETLIKRGLDRGTLTFSDRRELASEADVVWVTYDTPVDDSDRPDDVAVESEVEQLFPYLRSGCLVLVSSQVLVGFVRRLEHRFAESFPGIDAHFAYSPENLRLGEAIATFCEPDRVVAGIRRADDRKIISELFAGISSNILWMSPESAEMTKHALNGFLAASISFANEIATICERVGADAKDVERGLRSDSRIGSRAYLAAGTGFGGGTLGRDIAALSDIALRETAPAALINAVHLSNAEHKKWAKRSLLRTLGNVDGRTITLLGLTYKPGTNTLRRSDAVNLARWLTTSGAHVIAFDPAITSVNDDGIATSLELAPSADKALENADAAVVCTEWPAFRELSATIFSARMRNAIVLDPKRFLEAALGADERIRYLAVGRGKTQPKPGL